MHRSRRRPPARRQLPRHRRFRFRHAAALVMTAGALVLFRLALVTPESPVPPTRLAEHPVFVTAMLRAELGLAADAAEPAESTFFLERSDAAISLPETEPLQPEPPDTVPEPEPPEADSTPHAAASIKERTLTAGSGPGWLTARDITVYDRAGVSLDLDALMAAPPQIGWTNDAPQVLIYHTHGTEAYAMDGTDVYTESDPSRTTDLQYNMIRVGDELAAELKSHGITVIHDRTLYDYPNYNNSYARSLEGVEACLAAYPSIRVVIDLHRDALEAADGTIYKTVAKIDGTPASQLLLVVGTDAAGQTHPDWQQNLRFALSLQQQLDRDWPTLARPLTLRSYRYNQQVLPGALLIEVGTHGNTLQESLTSARLLGQSLASLLTTPAP